MLRNIIEQIEPDTLLIVAKEVQTIWKNLIDSYRKKSKVALLENLWMNKYLIGDTLIEWTF